MMMIVDADGKPLLTIVGTDEVIALNTPRGCYAVPEAPAVESYFDFSFFKWVTLPPRPSTNHTFDYTAKEWIDARTLETSRALAWSEVKRIRDNIEFGGFTYDGNVYDSDQVSQGRIIGAASAGIDQTWTLADNTTVELTAQQIKELYAALQAHIASVHERGRIARQLIFNAETKEQVEAVQLM